MNERGMQKATRDGNNKVKTGAHSSHTHGVLELALGRGPLPASHY